MHIEMMARLAITTLNTFHINRIQTIAIEISVMIASCVVTGINNAI